MTVLCIKGRPKKQAIHWVIDTTISVSVEPCSAGKSPLRIRKKSDRDPQLSYCFVKELAKWWLLLLDPKAQWSCILMQPVATT